MGSFSPRACGVAAGLAVALSSSTIPARAAQGDGASLALKPAPIACKVMEAKTSAALHVTTVVFHQGEAARRGRVGAWLRKHDGAVVEFETPDGQWHPASVFRLKSCFGRGLLVFSADTARLEDGSTFVLRLPEKASGATLVTPRSPDGRPRQVHRLRVASPAGHEP